MPISSIIYILQISVHFLWYFPLKPRLASPSLGSQAEKDMIFDYVRRSRPYFPGLFSEQVCEKLDEFFKSAPDSQRSEMLAVSVCHHSSSLHTALLLFKEQIQHRSHPSHHVTSNIIVVTVMLFGPNLNRVALGFDSSQLRLMSLDECIRALHCPDSS